MLKNPAIEEDQLYEPVDRHRRRLKAKNLEGTDLLHVIKQCGGRLVILRKPGRYERYFTQHGTEDNPWYCEITAMLFDFSSYRYQKDFSGIISEFLSSWQKAGKRVSVLIFTKFPPTVKVMVRPDRNFARFCSDRGRVAAAHWGVCGIPDPVLQGIRARRQWWWA